MLLFIFCNFNGASLHTPPSDPPDPRATFPIKGLRRHNGYPACPRRDTYSYALPNVPSNIFPIIVWIRQPGIGPNDWSPCTMWYENHTCFTVYPCIHPISVSSPFIGYNAHIRRVNNPTGRICTSCYFTSLFNLFVCKYIYFWTRARLYSFVFSSTWLMLGFEVLF